MIGGKADRFFALGFVIWALDFVIWSFSKRFVTPTTHFQVGLKMLAVKLLGTAARPQLIARAASPFVQPAATRSIHSSRPVLMQSFDDSGISRLQDTPVNIVRLVGTCLSHLKEL